MLEFPSRVMVLLKASLLLSIMTLRLRRSLFLMVVMDTLTELLTKLKLEFPLVQPQLHLMSSSLPMVDMEPTFTENLVFRFCSIRFENDIENPDFITGNEVARIGICENPIEQGTSTLLTKDKVVYIEACWNWIW